MKETRIALIGIIIEEEKRHNSNRSACTIWDHIVAEWAFPTAKRDQYHLPLF